MLKKNHYVAHEVHGYFANDIKMFNMVRCPDHEYAQCGFKVEYGNLNFYSYSSLLFQIPLNSIKTEDGYYGRYEFRLLFGEVAPNYSRTTINHTRYFLQAIEGNGSYQLLKDMYNNGKTELTYFGDRQMIDSIIAMY